MVFLALNQRPTGSRVRRRSRLDLVEGATLATPCCRGVQRFEPLQESRLLVQLHLQLFDLLLFFACELELVLFVFLWLLFRLILSVQEMLPFLLIFLSLLNAEFTQDQMVL